MHTALRLLTALTSGRGKNHTPLPDLTCRPKSHRPKPPSELTEASVPRRGRQYPRSKISSKARCNCSVSAPVVFQGEGRRLVPLSLSAPRLAAAHLISTARLHLLGLPFPSILPELAESQAGVLRETASGQPLFLGRKSHRVRPLPLVIPLCSQVKPGPH